MGSKTRRRRKRCSVCEELFFPDPRVGPRQRTCGASSCRVEQRRRTQAAWREHNPDYWHQRRFDARVAQLEGGGEVAWRAPPEVLRELPREAALDAFTPKACVFIALLVRLVLRAAQDAMARQALDIHRRLATLAPAGVQDEMGPQGFDLNGKPGG